MMKGRLLCGGESGVLEASAGVAAALASQQLARAEATVRLARRAVQEGAGARERGEWGQGETHIRLISRTPRRPAHPAPLGRMG